MSRRPQIHLFFGAPILSTAPSSPKGENDSSANEKPWRELHLSFTNETSNLCITNLSSLEHESANDAVLIVHSKDHFPVNFEKRGGSVNDDCATSVGCVKSFSHKKKVLGESRDGGSVCSGISRGNQKKHHVAQQSKKDYIKGDANCIIDSCLESSPLVFEVKDLKNCVVVNHNPSYLQSEPQGENLLLSQYLKRCSQKADESKPRSVLDVPSNLDLSTDNEFLSILTLSQVALCSGQYAVGQNEMQNKPTAGEGVELALPCREDIEDGEPLRKSNEDGDTAAKKVDTNCEADSDCSIQLFDSDNSSQDNSDFKKCSPLSSPVNNEGQDLKPQQKRQLCPPEDHHAERSQETDDNVMTSRFTSGDQQLSKRIKLASSPLCPVKTTRILGIEKAQKQLSLLKDCVEKSRKFSVLVVVLHPCHIKEIKTGSTASCKVPLATVVVADQSEVRQKVVLWRAAAFLSLTVFPGDIVLFTDVVVCENRWVGEMMLQSTFTTKLVNLGSCSAINPKEASHIVDWRRLQDLLTYVCTKHSPLHALPPRPRQSLDHVPRVLLSWLKPDTLVHAVLRVINIAVLRESVYSFKGEKQSKIVLTVEQIKGQPYALVVWGDAATQCLQLQRKKDHIWEFRYLLVKHHPVSGDLELHTTPWSVIECLFDDDERALAFKEKFEMKASMKMTTLASHLEEKSSGIIQVKACVSKLSFTDASLSHGQLVFDADTSLEHIFASLPLITYKGCGKCGRERQTDDNEIYKECLTCLPLNQVKVFYRPAVMTVEEGDYEISVRVGPELMEKIFLNIPAAWLKKVVERPSDTTYGMLVADLCHSLLTDSKASYLLTIKSHFVLDENSFPLEKDFQLLEFHLDL
ncbi:shieldin complex subunit 2 [Thamnophis elegans]|uniref:shieldin complex subunit 2 n=1 Tax=Thamnophis elegans TaxID=35005 RepID=UPI0013764D8F|nr:shieldin complex subunit 2 [Thamnophis elegans]XP_032087705.1 shieldin complex subunit 2 [Thamnophis elegans]XP_032087706.1 shieldin complex subunit 2 [Thamnophis elegans]XP_032087707.1 shieldin complex subunit 2 [Thamnophis elegans]XP_032087708.1 shieldin complex subunit 2 [Thamnophis elegans]